MAKYSGVYEVETISTPFGITLGEGSQVLNLATSNVWRLDEDALDSESLEDVQKTAIAGETTLIPVITPSSPFTADANLKSQFFAIDSGTYTNYGGLVLLNESAFIDYDGNGGFTKSKQANYFFENMPNNTSVYLDGFGNFTTPSIGATSYTSQSFTSQTSVTVTHNLGVKPVIQVIGSDNKVLIPLDIEHASVNEAVITFDESTTGTILVTVGSNTNENAYSIKSANYTILNTDRTIEVDTGGVTITLPTAVGIQGQTFRIINTSIGTVTIDTTSSQTIGNQNTGNPTSIDIYDGEELDVQSNNSNYRIIN